MLRYVSMLHCLGGKVWTKEIGLWITQRQQEQQQQQQQQQQPGFGSDYVSEQAQQELENDRRQAERLVGCVGKDKRVWVSRESSPWLFLHIIQAPHSESSLSRSCLCQHLL